MTPPPPPPWNNETTSWKLKCIVFSFANLWQLLLLRLLLLPHEIMRQHCENYIVYFFLLITYDKYSSSFSSSSSSSSHVKLWENIVKTIVYTYVHAKTKSKINMKMKNLRIGEALENVPPGFLLCLCHCNQPEFLSCL